MAKFFETYPKLVYGTRIVTDVLARVALREKYSNKVQLYYTYDLQEGDTPEIIASKYYDSAYKHWIVLIMNEIIDPVFDFPLSYSTFITYLDTKFKTQGDLVGLSGSEYAKITLNPDPSAYRAIITTTDLVSGTETINKFFIDQTAYIGGYDHPNLNYPDYINQVGSILYKQTTEQVFIFDYEQELNEAKRKIKLLRPEYVSQFEKELAKLMSEQYV
jgi:hypothetical protein